MGTGRVPAPRVEVRGPLAGSRGRRLLLWRRGTRKCEGAGLRDLTQVPAPAPPTLRTRPRAPAPSKLRPREPGVRRASASFSSGLSPLISQASLALSCASPASGTQAIPSLGNILYSEAKVGAQHTQWSLGGTGGGSPTTRAHARDSPLASWPASPGLTPLPAGLSRAANERAQCPPPGLPIPALPERRSWEVSRAKGSSQSARRCPSDNSGNYLYLHLPNLSYAHGPELLSLQSEHKLSFQKRNLIISRNSFIPLFIKGPLGPKSENQMEARESIFLSPKPRALRCYIILTQSSDFPGRACKSNNRAFV